MVMLGWERRRMVSMVWRGRGVVRIVGVRRGHHPTRHTCEGKPHMSVEISSSCTLH